MREYIIIGTVIFSGMIMIRAYALRKHTFLAAAAGMLTGAGGLILLHYFGGHIGYEPPLNLFNTAVSLVLGLPGVGLIMGVNIFL